YLNRRRVGSFDLVDYRLLADEEKQLVEYCSQYSEESASLMDAALQLWYKGFIESNGDRCLSENGFSSNVFDNYRFLRRFFGPFGLGIHCFCGYAACIIPSRNSQPLLPIGT